MLLCGCVCVSMCVHKMCRSVQIKVREVILVIKIRIHHYAHRETQIAVTTATIPMHLLRWTRPRVHRTLCWTRLIG